MTLLQIQFVLTVLEGLIRAFDPGGAVEKWVGHVQALRAAVAENRDPTPEEMAALDADIAAASADLQAAADRLDPPE